MTTTLKALILLLDNGTRTTRQIADLVDCDLAYVRTVRQRQLGPRPSDQRYHLVPKNIARRIRRKVYHAYRKKGRSCDDARSAATRAIYAHGVKLARGDVSP